MPVRLSPISNRNFVCLVLKTKGHHFILSLYQSNEASTRYYYHVSWRDGKPGQERQITSNVSGRFKSWAVGHQSQVQTPPQLSLVRTSLQLSSWASGAHTKESPLLPSILSFRKCVQISRKNKTSFSLLTWLPRHPLKSEKSEKYIGIKEHDNHIPHHRPELSRNVLASSLT